MGSVHQFPNRTPMVLTGNVVLEPNVPKILGELLEEAITESRTTTKQFKKVASQIDTTSHFSEVEGEGFLILETVYRQNCGYDYAIHHPTDFLEFGWYGANDDEYAILEEVLEDPILTFQDYIQRSFCSPHPLILFVAKVLSQLWLNPRYQLVKKWKTEVLSDAVTFHFVDKSNLEDKNIYRITFKVLPILLDNFVSARLQSERDRSKSS